MGRYKTVECLHCGATPVKRGKCLKCYRAYQTHHKRVARGLPSEPPPTFKRSTRLMIAPEKRGLCVQKKKPPPYTAVVPCERRESGRALDPYVAITPVLEVGRRIPAPDAPMAEKLECVEWLEYYERKGMLEWARREANLWQEA